MLLIDRNHIENWAETIDSKGKFSLLIQKLIRATTPVSSKGDFPFGTGIYTAGWDGIVICEKETSYVPEGTSLWELGTEDNPKAKAEKDYQKRTANPLGFDISQCTFIFVTLRFWQSKREWCKEKNEEGRWKKVEVYDSSNLAQWLQTAPAIARWFSNDLGIVPFDGTQTAEEFWEEWSVGPRCILIPEIITSRRDYQKNLLLTFLKSAPGIRGIKASTKTEAIAFIVACAQQFELDERERFFDKTLIIETEANYRATRINSNTPLNLIPRFENTQPIYAAVSNGHHVLVPVGADDSFNQDTISLPTIDRDGQIEGLIKVGFSRSDAEKYSREAGRNITILQKLIGFPQFKASWSKSPNIREIVPPLLLGRWSEKFQGDKALLKQFSGSDYNEIIPILFKWRDVEESPLLQIGETWRLTSPLDAWTNISTYLTSTDFELLKEGFRTAFSNGNPLIEPIDLPKYPVFATKERTYSNWARDGLVQSLIIVGLYGESLKMNIAYPQQWVDNLVKSLLTDADEELWISLNHEMPLLAEASPTSFFEAVYSSLANPEKPIMAMFKEEEGTFSPVSHHTGLLWALESLAWLPEYLYNAGNILLKFSAIDPGGKLTNRPINSLVEIFKPWHHQSLVSFEERMEVLKKITLKNKEYGWILLIRLLPDRFDVAHPTHKMRWRLFDKNVSISHDGQEMYKAYSFITDLLISIFPYQEKQFAELLDISVNERFHPDDRNKILDFAARIYNDVPHNEFITWHALRKIISHHRSHPQTPWALSEEDLLRYENLYHKLEPTDPLHKYLWLFDEWPNFIEGASYESDDAEHWHKKQEREVEKRRIEGLTKILAYFGIEKIKELIKTVKEPWSLGDTLAKIIDNNGQLFSIIELIESKEANMTFLHSFILRKSIIEGIDWVFSLFQVLKQKGFQDKALTNLFIPLEQSKALWNFIDDTTEEIKKEYWLKVEPHFYRLSKEEKITGLKSLLHYKRFFSALDICSHSPEEIPTELIIEILTKSATEKADERTRIHGYEVGHLFEAIDKRTDVEHKTLVQLEWLYLPILDPYRSNRTPKILHDELANNPVFFVEVLKWVFIPKDKEILEQERKDLSKDAIENNAKQGYQLLYSWKKIPGVTEDGTINNEFLISWINTARNLAKEVGRLEVADMQIGKVLAQYPEKSLNWPPDEISTIIESINTDSIKRNFSAAIFNKRGTTSRGVFDDGEQERVLARHFRELANNQRIKHPTVAAILEDLAKGYDEDAKREDNEAEREKLEY